MARPYYPDTFQRKYIWTIDGEPDLTRFRRGVPEGLSLILQWDHQNSQFKAIPIPMSRLNLQESGAADFCLRNGKDTSSGLTIMRQNPLRHFRTNRHTVQIDSIRIDQDYMNVVT